MSASISEQLQRDLYERISADPFFADVHVFLVRPREKLGWAQLAELVDIALAGQKKKAGKAGVAVQVLMPQSDVSDANVAGPRKTLTITARVQEIPIINMGPAGTFKSCEEVAERIEQLGHQFADGRGNVLLYAETTPNDTFEQRVTNDVSFKKQTGLSPYRRAGNVLLIPVTADGVTTVTAEAGTPGAAIHYTLDGDYPSPLTGTLYTAPFVVTAPATVRAAATSAGLQQGNVATLTLS